MNRLLCATLQPRAFAINRAIELFQVPGTILIRRLATIVIHDLQQKKKQFHVRSKVQFFTRLGIFQGCPPFRTSLPAIQTQQISLVVILHGSSLATKRHTNATRRRS